MRPVALPGRARITLVTAALAAVYAWGAFNTEFNPVVVVRELPAFFRLLAEMVPPNLAILPRLKAPLLQTVQIAILGTAIGAVLAVPVVVLASRNLTLSAWVYYAARGVMNLIRTIPELLYAAILVAAVGFGPFPGVLALSVFSLGIVAKLTSESVEAIDPGPLEALVAAGATRLETIRYAVVPQVLPLYVSYVLYVFEINVRVSTVLGVVGAGGIGQSLMTALSLFQYRNAATIVLVTFVMVVVIDAVGARLRARLV